MDNRELSYGEKLVGINFNPSSDNKVDRVKALCAELADIINQEVGVINEDSTTALQKILFNHTIGEILNAQMNIVKLITLKY